MAKSSKAVELAGDIDTLLLDKTDTITVGDRSQTDPHFPETQLSSGTGGVFYINLETGRMNPVPIGNTG